MYKFTEKHKQNLLKWSEWLDNTELSQGVEALKKNELEEVWDDSPMDEDVDALPIFIDEEPTGPPSYCCLGVYVEMRDPSYYVSMDEYNGEWLCNVTKKPKWKEHNTSYLPKVLARELGMAGNKLQDAFVTLNDDLHYTFKEIAEEIRHLVSTGDFTGDVRERLGDDSDL